MKTQKLRWILSAAMLFALIMSSSVWSQDLDPWEINADVDNDGIVGPTDIQHVINDALGLNDRGVDAVDLPLRQYVVASPRASLALIPGTTVENADACSTIGAASNFARRNGRLLVRKNTGIAFVFDRNTEGVWYDNACGLLRAELVVEIQRLQPAAGDAEATEGTDRPVIDEDAWRPIGRDGAAGRGCGPLVGTAAIGVRHRFEVAGDFVVRCTIRTFAIPQREIVADGETPDFCGASRAVDQVLTHIRVVDRRALDEDVDWQTEDDANSVGARYGTRLENEPVSTVALPEE